MINGAGGVEETSIQLSGLVDRSVALAPVGKLPQRRTRELICRSRKVLTPCTDTLYDQLFRYIHENAFLLTNLLPNNLRFGPLMAEFTARIPWTTRLRDSMLV